MILNFFNKLVF